MNSPQVDEKQTSARPKGLILQRLLYALMVGDPQWVDEREDFIHNIAQGDNTDPNGRVWWRLPRSINDPEGFVPGYVSLNPGEFRLERPVGPHEIIREAAPSTNPRRLSDLLKKEIRIFESHADELDAELRLLKRQGEKLLHNMQTNTYDEGLNLFREATQNLRTGKEHSGQEVVNRLYKECLFDFLLPGTTFAMAMALLQIQMGIDVWIEQDCYADARSFLGSFLEVTSKEYPQILEGAAKIGNWHFEDGQKHLKDALSSVTLHSFYRLLYIAAHHFWAACAIAKDSADVMTSGELGYTALIAEESWACVITGLNSELWEFADRKNPFEDSLATHFQNDQEQAAQDLVRDLTRPTNPALPKHYARVSLARAMIRAGKQWTKKGIELLHSLEKEFYSRVQLFEDSRSELFRIESGLLTGYRDIGDEEAAKRIATRMVGRAIVNRSLGKP